MTDCLLQKGIESFCPVQRVKRQWSDRVKTIEEPLFRSCIFVKITTGQRTDVRLTEGALNFVYRDGKPLVVKEKDIRVLKRHLAEVEQGSLPPISEEAQESMKARKSTTLYLNRFRNWLTVGMERPKLV